MLNKIALTDEILKNCETAGGTKYLCSETAPEINSEGRDIYVVSDFHLTDLNHINEIPPDHPELEIDKSFSNFISYLLENGSTGKGLLIINGDFVDFIRITRVPVTENDYLRWAEVLFTLGINKNTEELRSSVTRLERKHGLNTSETKSVWKLSLVINSHPDLFSALALWIGRGNKIIMVKGNHDLELYWPAVRNLFRITIAGHLSRLKKESLEKVLKKEIIPQLSFADDKLIIDGSVHVEHGHVYDKFCRSIGGPLSDNSEDINIPFGSFFNIYLLNHIELISRQNLKNILFEKSTLHPVTLGRHFLGIKVIFSHIPLLFTSIPRHYYRHLFGRIVPFFFMFLFPLFMLMNTMSNSVERMLSWVNKGSNQGSFIVTILRTRFFRFAEGLALSLLFYLFSSITGKFRLKGINSLPNFAKRNLIEDKRIKIVIMGHTHYPDYFESKGRHFYNTGTWIPTIRSIGETVQRKTDFTFLHLDRTMLTAGGRETQPGVENLKRWNSQSGRAEPLIMPFSESTIAKSVSA